MKRLQDRADGRPRVHIWPSGSTFAWSIGPLGLRTSALTAGAALDAALARLATPAVVVIVEPNP